MTPWTVAHQSPLSMEFSRQEYWSGLPFPSPGDLPDPETEPGSPALQTDSLLSEPQGSLPLKAEILIGNGGSVAFETWGRFIACPQGSHLILSVLRGSFLVPAPPNHLVAHSTPTSPTSSLLPVHAHSPGGPENCPSLHEGLWLMLRGFQKQKQVRTLGSEQEDYPQVGPEDQLQLGGTPQS